MFDVFRRHQKKWLAALTITALFAFSFPMLFQGGSSDERRPKQTVVETIFGREITNFDLGSAQQERRIANEFVVQMIAAADPRAVPFLGNFEYFGNSRNEDAIKDAIRLSYKADEFGVTVGDEMVRSWITEMTDGKLTTDQFRIAVRNLQRTHGQGLTQDILFDILRRQLRIRRVQDLAFGRFGGASALVTPYEAWQFYRKLNDKISMQLIPVSVSDFADQIADPGDDVLRELYNRYADRPADPSSPEPGFKEPHKVQLQYAYASVDAFALVLKPEVTEDEIKKFYEDRQELFRIFKPPGGDAKSQTDAPEGDMKPEEPSEPAEKPQAEPTPSKPEQDKQPTEQKSESNPSGDEDEAGVETNQDDPPPAGKPDEPQEPEPSGQQRTQAESKDSPQKDAAEAKESQQAEQKKREPEEKKEEEPQYKSLEEVTEEIRDRLARNKAREDLLRRLDQVKREVYKFADTYMEAEIQIEEKKAKKPATKFEPPDASGFSEGVQQLIKEQGLSYGETELISLEELGKRLGIGTTIEGWSDSAIGEPISRIAPEAKLYDPREFKNFEEQYFLVWKIADRPAESPFFRDIRDKVLAAHRTIEARKLAQARAGELAKAVRDAGGDIEKFREQRGEIETISIDGLTLWSSLQLSPTRPFALGEVVTTELPNVRQPGEILRTLAFSLKEGETGVAPNQPEDAYYVVLVTKHERAGYDDFARSRDQVERQLQTMRMREKGTQWVAELRKQSAGGKVKAPSGN